MDGGGRLDQPLRRRSRALAQESGASHDEPLRPRAGRRARGIHFGFLAGVTPTVAPLGRWAARIARLPPPGLGLAASALLIAATFGYGVMAGGHAPVVVDWFKDARDTAANALGFRIAAISLTGPKEVSREQILALAGVTGHASLLFLDADAARKNLLANPWIADAAVLKLYPDRLQITITERQAFALWQKDRHVSVIAADGTILEPFVEQRYVTLPLVVGRGAEHESKDFLAILDGYPDIRSQLRASILVSGRRWNLRLKNGIDVLLPETNVAAALDRLVTLDREKKLLSRDILAVDLRLADRVSVRLSDAAAAAREDAFKDKKKKKGGDA
jgi:cell division protein FtsQ